MEKNITLSEDKFKRIYCGYLKYLALQNGGVDNWSWYGDSLGDFLKECYLENHPDKTLEDLFNEDYDFDMVVDEDLERGNF